LYVGDDSGNVHKFTGTFSGTPAEAGAPWYFKKSKKKKKDKIKIMKNVEIEYN